MGTYSQRGRYFITSPAAVLVDNPGGIGWLGASSFITAPFPSGSPSSKLKKKKITQVDPRGPQCPDCCQSPLLPPRAAGAINKIALGLSAEQPTGKRNVGPLLVLSFLPAQRTVGGGFAARGKAPFKAIFVKN